MTTSHRHSRHNFSSSPRLNHADMLTKRRLNHARAAVNQAGTKKKGSQEIDLRSPWVPPPSLTHHVPQINAIAIAVKQCMTASRDLAALANNPVCSNTFRQELLHGIRRLHSKTGVLLTEFEDSVLEYERQRASRSTNHAKQAANSPSTEDLTKLRHSRNQARLK